MANDHKPDAAHARANSAQRPHADAHERPSKAGPSEANSHPSKANPRAEAIRHSPSVQRPNPTPLLEQRERCLAYLQDTGVLTDARVGEAMRKIPRERFVPPAYREQTWVDYPLPLTDEQTISAPHMYAILMQAADLKPGQKVLEVGTGSGYGTALLKELVGHGGEVYSIEINPDLSDKAGQVLREAGYQAELIVGDGHRGHLPAAPYDRIIVTAAAEHLPQALWDQLKVGGKLLIPVGGLFGTLMFYHKEAEGLPLGAALGPVAFVPLRHARDERAGGLR